MEEGSSSGSAARAFTAKKNKKNVRASIGQCLYFLLDRPIKIADFWWPCVEAFPEGRLQNNNMISLGISGRTGG
jgi:hypothetical protein